MNILFVILAVQGHAWKQALSPACSQQFLLSALRRQCMTGCSCLGRQAGGRAQPPAPAWWCGSAVRDWNREGPGQSVGKACRAAAWPLCACCAGAGMWLSLPVHGRDSRRLLWAPAERCWRSLHSGTEEAHGGAGPALLLAHGGGRARGGNAPHSHPDHQGAAAEQRHRRTLQGPGSHAAKVGWPGLQHRALLPRLGAEAPPLPGMGLQRRCWLQLALVQFPCAGFVP